MANLKFGSTGSEVEKLQNALIEAGYDVGSTKADGIFGKNTLAAVKQYQKDNGLTEDGIAGKNTLGKLYSTSGSTGTNTSTGTASTGSAAKTATASTGSKSANATASTAAKTNTTTPASIETATGFTYDDFSYDDYAKDDIVLEAEALLQQQIASKPGDYTPVWQDEADAYLSQYQNRDPFSYDFNSDALYNQYKDQYIQQGQMAMMDTMGQAAALTGGYGNSYAQTAGQMAYNQQLSQLNAIMPELYSMAYDRYNQEGQNLLDMYNLYMDREAQERSNYQTELSNWYSMLDYYTNNYNTLYEQDYDEYLNNRSLAFDKWSSNLGISYDDYMAVLEQEYEKERDAVADSQWQQEFDQNEAAINYNNLVDLITSTGYTPTAAELKAAGMTDTQAQAYKNYYDSAQTTGGSGDGGGTGGVGESGIDLDHVSSMSSYELVGYLENYQKKGNDTGLAAFLDDCEATGRLTQQQVDYYYSIYKTEEDEEPVDTNVGLTGSTGVGGGYGGGRNAYLVNMII